MLGSSALRRWRVTVALVVLSPLASGVAHAQAEPGSGRASPITVTTLHGPNGESLEAPSPLAERPARAINESGQVVATIDADPWGRGDVVLWDQGVATRISPEGIKAHPTDISDNGQIIGDPLGGTSPFSWEDGEWRWLPVPDGMYGDARAVNNHRQVLGFLTLYNEQGGEEKIKVGAWSGDQFVEAPVDFVINGPRPVEAVDINDQGLAVFNVKDYGPPRARSTAYAWEVGGDATAIESAEAVGVNNHGQVFGRVMTPDGYHAFLWEDGQMTDLGTLGGARSRATAINDRGQVVGISETEAGDGWHAFLWEDGVMTDLGNLGVTTTFAVDVNDSGQVVGSSTVPSASGGVETHAFLWQNGTMTDLAELLDEPPPDATARISSGIDINDRGQVVGAVTTVIGATRFQSDVVLWTVPWRR